MKNATKVNLKKLRVHIDGTIMLDHNFIYLCATQHRSANCSRILLVHFAWRTPWIKAKLGLSPQHDSIPMYIAWSLWENPMDWQSGARIRCCSAALWSSLWLFFFFTFFFFRGGLIDVYWYTFYVWIWQISLLVTFVVASLIWCFWEFNLI